MSGLRAFDKGWGYKVDYDKEIAADLKEIAVAERHVPLAATLTAEERTMGPCHITLFHWLMNAPAVRAPLIGLTAADVVDWCWFGDSEAACLPHAAEPAPGWYSRGAATDKRIEAEFGGYYVVRDATELLKKLRTRLTRHRRNQRKFG